jgi:hypothetical protein
VSSAPLSNVTNSAVLGDDFKFSSSISLSSSIDTFDFSKSRELSESDSISRMSSDREKHKSKRQAKKDKAKKRKQKDFLSYVPEIEADIQYRFTFFVVGEAAEKLVEAACSSDEARALPDKTAGSSPSPYISEVPSEEGDLSLSPAARCFTSEVSDGNCPSTFASGASRGCW